jgi:hypothetical protein
VPTNTSDDSRRSCAGCHRPGPVGLAGQVQPLNVRLPGRLPASAQILPGPRNLVIFPSVLMQDAIDLDQMASLARCSPSTSTFLAGFLPSAPNLPGPLYASSPLLADISLLPFAMLHRPESAVPHRASSAGLTTPTMISLAFGGELFSLSRTTATRGFLHEKLALQSLIPGTSQLPAAVHLPNALAVAQPKSFRLPWKLRNEARLLTPILSIPVQMSA